uniref:Uncharacterized protein n=1 Tax=Rhizophora mucronata TaxID=61149 RepID=A0A2P2Q5K2_RHIMU
MLLINTEELSMSNNRIFLLNFSTGH